MISYKDIIKNNMNDTIENRIGKVDLIVFDKKSIDILFYLFPLIEKTVLEFLKLYNYTDVEHYQQGKYRTLYSLICNDGNSKLIPNHILSRLKMYYNDLGIRNRLLHYNKDYINIEIKLYWINDIRNLFCDLLILYNQSLTETAKKSNIPIAFI